MRGVPAEGGSEAYLRVRRSAARARQSAYGGQMGLFQQPAKRGKPGLVGRTQYSCDRVVGESSAGEPIEQPEVIEMISPHLGLWPTPAHSSPES